MNWRLLRSIDWALWLLPLFLVAFGITILISFSFGPKNLALYQLVYAVLGILVMVTLTFFDYRSFKSLSWYLYGVNIILLILVAYFGTQIFGARRWLDLGYFQLQPSELLKIVAILFVGRVLAVKEIISWRKIIVLALLLGLPLVLILRQPDLGTTAVLVVTSLVMLAYGKMPKYFWLVLGMLILIAAPIAWGNLRPYQKDRIYTFLYPSRDPAGVGYNVAQAKIAVGSGGIWGRGLGQGSQSQLNFLPVAHTDFIFAAIAEASGFVGSVVLLGLFMALIWRILNLTMISQDEFSRFIAIGAASLFLFQVGVNIGMNLGLLPVTGIPLPFVSFGGSGMITNFALIGILQSIYIRHKKIRFG